MPYFYYEWRNTLFLLLANRWLNQQGFLYLLIFCDSTPIYHQGTISLKLESKM